MLFYGGFTLASISNTKLHETVSNFLSVQPYKTWITKMWNRGTKWIYSTQVITLQTWSKKMIHGTQKYYYKKWYIFFWSPKNTFFGEIGHCILNLYFMSPYWQIFSTLNQVFWYQGHNLDIKTPIFRDLIDA